MSIDINRYIEEHLEDIDLTHLVKHEIREQVQGDIAREIKVIVREQIERIIADEIDLVIASPVELNSGYSRSSYKSFEDFFKAEFKKKMDASYDVQRTITTATTKAVNKMFAEKYNDAIDKIVAELTKEK